MKRRRTEYLIWLLSAAILYFFENNTGTRAVLAASAAVPFFLRLPARRKEKRRTSAGMKTVPAETGALPENGAETDRPKSAADGEDEPDVTVREYVPGDPVRRIHWKLSAKTDRLMIRERAPAEEEIIRRVPAPAVRDRRPDGEERENRLRRRLLTVCLTVLAAAAALLLLTPAVRNGAKELCNRLFERSEAVNAYVYERFRVPEGSSAAAASLALAAAGAAWAVSLTLFRSRVPAVLTAVLLSGFQAYFGISFPPAVNVLLYAGLGALLLPGGPSRKALLKSFTAAGAAAVLVCALWPGTDAATEEASERARDLLSKAALQISGSVSETPADSPETRHMNSRSVLTGGEEAGEGKNYRLVTEEEERISRPHRTDYMKAALLLLLAAAVITVPFLPFAILSAKRKKEREARMAFQSGDVSEAVRAMFQHLIRWMRLTDHDPGNLLYRDWTQEMARLFSKEYADRYARCAAIFEEAVYSNHPVSAEAREEVRALLEETERMLYDRADRKQRFRLRYMECVCE